MEEIWKDIKDYEGLYQVSNQGRVKSLARLDSIGRKVKERIRKLNPNDDGYLCVCLNKEGKGKTTKAHRLVAEAFIPNPENKPTVDHRYGNKTDNRVENLRWATRKEQMDWASNEQGLINNQGQNHGSAKLTDSDVVSIIAELQRPQKDISGAQIAIDRSIDPTTITAINTGKTWSHILPHIRRPIR